MRSASILFFSALSIAVVASQGCSSADDTDSTSADDLTKACKGPLPQICELCGNGTSECAHWVKENGKCEIQICPPLKAGECNTAKDCTGPLPELCEICEDGGEACAHHACVNHKCETAICN